jgi:hypothetical protein
MDYALTFLANNKEWLFSGIGVFVLSALLLILRQIFSSHTNRAAATHTESATPSLTTRGHRFELSDGTVAYARLRVTYSVTDPLLFFQSFKDHAACKRAFAPLIHARACYLLEQYPFDEAKLHRREAELTLVEELAGEYAKVGLQLGDITIGSLIRADRFSAKPTRGSFEKDDKSGAIPLTPLSYSLHFNIGTPGGPLTLADGARASMELQLICRIVNPYLAVFGTSDNHFMDTLAPIVCSRVHQIVERQSLPDARANRKTTEAHLRTELEPEFRKFGVTIESFFLGALDRINQAGETGVA